MKYIKNLVFGCSGTIGIEISKRLNKNNTLLLSRSKPKDLKISNWKKIDLSKEIKILPKKVNKIFFLSSPYYIKKNFNKKIFYNEYIWLKKILNNIQVNYFIYFSSSSVYLNNHPLGKIKLKCEKLLLDSNINVLQIWRPFNIIGDYQNSLSDHFHNLLIKNFVKKKYLSKKFLGNGNDRRGYSSAKKFSKKVIWCSNSKKSFTFNYGNSNTITVSKIALIFSKLIKKKYNRSISVIFNNKKKNINTINSITKVKTINSSENSKNILKQYFKRVII